MINKKSLYETMVEMQKEIKEVEKKNEKLEEENEEMRELLIKTILGD